MEPEVRRRVAAQPSMPEPDSQKISALIGDVYDAALDQSLWPGVIERAAHFVGGIGAALFSKDASGQFGDVKYDVGIDPHYEQLYFDKYVGLDPATTGHLFAEAGEPFSTYDLISHAEFTKTRFFQEWVRPQVLVDFATAVLDKSMTSVTMFGFFRHE